MQTVGSITAWLIATQKNEVELFFSWIVCTFNCFNSKYLHCTSTFMFEKNINNPPADTYLYGFRGASKALFIRIEVQQV